MNRFLQTVVPVAIFGLASVAPAAALTVKPIHAFCKTGGNCADGNDPSGVLRGADGNLYGTTLSGGAHRSGVVFELIASAKGSGKWKERVLYDFCSDNEGGGQTCYDGGGPVGTLVQDSVGNLYGTASRGGFSANDGTVFELVRGASGNFTYQNLYRFCQDGCSSGDTPLAGLSYTGQANGLPYDGVSPLYGTAEFGGKQRFCPDGGCGTVFALTPGKTWKFKMLFAFCQSAHCADGVTPVAPVMVDASGDLIGTADGGGSMDGGVMFKITGVGGTLAETVLYNFCSVGNHCSDGAVPASPLTIDASGALYGMTAFGGKEQNGTVYRLAPDGTLSALYLFCTAHEFCFDGRSPSINENVLLDGAGHLYGATPLGGIPGGPDGKGSGILFEIAGSAYHVRHAFCSQYNCKDGGNPQGAIAMGPNGEIYGAASTGGKYGHGVIYEFR